MAVKVLGLIVVFVGICFNFVIGQGFGGGFGNGNGGGGGFMRGGFHEISQSLTPQQHEQVKAIFMDPTTPKYITKQKLRAFFQRIGGIAASKYFEFHEKMQARKAMMQGMFERRLSMMDPGMLRIMQQIRSIHQNENISFAQERAQIKQIIATAAPEVRQRFQEMRERFRGGFMGRGGMGGNNNNGGGMFGGGGGQGFGPFGRFQGFQGGQRFNSF